MAKLSYILTTTATLFLAVLGSAPAGPWDNFNYAPASKTVYPAAIRRIVGSVQNANNLVNNAGSATLVGSGSWVALDFGKEVGGLISLNFDTVTATSAVAFSFTESPVFIRPTASDDSATPNDSTTYDGVLRLPTPLSRGHFTQLAATLRGGFRFLTIVLNSDAAVTISNVSCAISFMPHVENLRDYSGYFYAKDPVFQGDEDFLTKIWYAGAYTIQTNTVPLHTGRVTKPIAPAGSWFNNATLGVAGPIIVDGAKRDRAVWPGDMGIAVPSQFVSTNDLIPTKNALSTMFSAINPTTGALPESGPPLSQLDSDTYHCWTLIGTHTYYMYTEDQEWLQDIWANYTKAVSFVLAKVDSSGLMNVTGLRDWARLGGGGHNSAGNALLYKVLTTGAELAAFGNNTAQSQTWLANAEALKSKFNEAFWVPSTGLYRDNQTTTLSPQDGNSFAVIFNLTTTPTRALAISTGLQRNWNDLGAVAPELPDTISPFIGGFEMQAHFEAGNDEVAMDLLRREWGYMLYTNLSVESTLLEGFTGNGSLSYRWYRGYNNDPAYTSHAHGWSTAPTSLLTFYVLGLTITSPQGRTWSVAPHLSGLSQAQGGFETGLGWFGVNWQLTNGTQLSLSIDTPADTTGVVRRPAGTTASTLLINEKQAQFDAEGFVNIQGGKSNMIISLVSE